jgi:ferredoxin-NADP reductase
MAVFTVRLQGRETVAERTMAFHFDKPPDFQFRAGQSVDVTLPDPPETDAEGNIRTFSIASAPRDPDIVVATRMRDTAFKRVLGAMAIGSEVQVDGPGGSFTLHHNSAKPAVLLAGGIGITPFRSIVRQATAERLPHKIFLFYGNNKPEDAPFLEDLQALTASNPNLVIVPTMTDMARSTRPWQGETRLIGRDVLLAHLPSLQGPIFYTAGPPGMVASLRAMLLGAGVDQDDVREEEFAGY